MLSRIVKIIVGIVGVILLMLLFGVLYQAIAIRLDESKYPAPGRLVDIGGYKLHINESYFAEATKDRSGSGLPSVVLDAGGYCFSLVWNFVQPEIAKFAHVCSYDRAGVGWSESSPLPRTSENIVKELHALLHAANVPAPYILVGHSLGGINMRLYANTYPDDVYGVVLVDSVHEAGEKRMKKFFEDYPKPKSCPKPSFFMQAFNWFITSDIAISTGITRLYQLFHKNVFDSVPESIRSAWIARELMPSSFRTMQQEVEHRIESFEQLEHSTNLLSNKPLIVITAGKSFEESDNEPADVQKMKVLFHENIWLPLQKDLVTKSKRGKQIIAEKSGHMIQESEPELIVAAVKEIVDEYRLTIENSTELGKEKEGKSMVDKENIRNVLKQARRIAIIGNSGSGKSTVARKIYDFCNLPLHHLDTYFWKSNWTPPNRDDYKIIHDRLCDQDEWIIEGANLSLWEHRMNRAEVIIILKIPRILCIWRIFKRTWTYYGKETPSSAPGCHEEVNFNFVKFLKWVWDFQPKYTEKVNELLDIYGDTKKIYVLSSQREIDLFLEELKKKNNPSQ